MNRVDKSNLIQQPACGSHFGCFSTVISKGSVLQIENETGGSDEVAREFAFTAGSCGRDLPV